MGLHQYDTTFTLDPRVDMKGHKEVTRGIGNQVTVEFNLLYRFHCAISLRDENYTESYIKGMAGLPKGFDPKDVSLQGFMKIMSAVQEGKKTKKGPEEQTFGLTKEDDPQNFQRDKITGLFNDQQMIEELLKSMDEPICEFEVPCFPRQYLD
jgi:hypothetical protein